MNVHTIRRTDLFSIWPLGFLWLPFWLILAGLAWSEEMPTAAAFRTELTKPADRAKVRLGDGKLTIDIRSKSGIGRGAVLRVAEAWPKTVVIKLHLSGLEKLQVTAGETTIAAAVSSNRPHDQRVEQIVGKDVVPLKADHPLWPTIRMFDAGGKPAEAVPLKNGHFEITLPAKLFEANPPSIDLEWIDFYRV